MKTRRCICVQTARKTKTKSANVLRSATIARTGFAGLIQLATNCLERIWAYTLGRPGQVCPNNGQYPKRLEDNLLRYQKLIKKQRQRA